jgi:GTP cyclohydrolase II
LLTNNPKKIEDLRNFGLHGITREKHVSGVGEWNRRYLRAKKKWGHSLDDEDFDL